MLPLFEVGLEAVLAREYFVDVRPDECDDLGESGLGRYVLRAWGAGCAVL